ncbi:MAG TPA: hypothetical protein VFI42_09460, partial [Thermomicrobiaceae bacterium]|nr:hypothetical protein [Thermomicrobiaceae bacterium]
MRVTSLVGSPFLVEGKEYLVFGLLLTVDSPANEVDTWITYFDGADLWDAPLGNFEIVDPRISRHWEFQRWTDGAVTLWPPSFAEEYYRSELRDWEPEVVADFKRVRRLLESEYAGDV